MAEASANFDDWRALLVDTVAIAREIGCHATVVATLEAVIGAPEPEDWHATLMSWSFAGDLKRWDEAARVAAAAVPAGELAKAAVQVFQAQLRFEQLRDTRLDTLLLKRAYVARRVRPGSCATPGSTPCSRRAP